jgi:hypothetical protein
MDSAGTLLASVVIIMIAAVIFWAMGFGYGIRTVCDDICGPYEHRTNAFECECKSPADEWVDPFDAWECGP